MLFNSSSRGLLINLPGHTVECFVRAFFNLGATTLLEQFHQFPPNFLVLLAGALAVRM